MVLLAEKEFPKMVLVAESLLPKMVFVAENVLPKIVLVAANALPRLATGLPAMALPGREGGHENVIKRIETHLEFQSRN